MLTCSLAYSHENGIVLIDLIQKCVIMNATLSDLYGGNSNIMALNRDISIQPFATSSILQHHYQANAAAAVAAANSISPSSISSNPNIIDPVGAAGNLSRLSQTASTQNGAYLQQSARSGNHNSSTSIPSHNNGPDNTNTRDPAITGPYNDNATSKSPNKPSGSAEPSDQVSTTGQVSLASP